MQAAEDPPSLPEAHRERLAPPPHWTRPVTWDDAVDEIEESATGAYGRVQWAMTNRARSVRSISKGVT